MRPPILYLTVAFGVGLGAGLDPFVFPGAVLWGVALPLIAAATCFAARAPLGAAVGIMGVAGLLWGTAAVRETEVTCSGRWTAGVRARENAGEGHTRAAIVRLADPAPAQGGRRVGGVALAGRHRRPRRHDLGGGREVDGCGRGRGGGRGRAGREADA